MGKEMYKSGDKVRVVSKSTGATLAVVGNIYTLKDKVDNGKHAPQDKKRKLWSTEELGIWCVSEFDIEKV